MEIGFDLITGVFCSRNKRLNKGPICDLARLLEEYKSLAHKKY